MTTAMELVPFEELGALAELSTDQVLKVVLAENALALRNGQEVVQHAIRCGHALLELQRRLPPGTWRKYSEENLPFSRWTANSYQRLALFSPYIQDWRTLTSMNLTRFTGPTKPPPLLIKRWIAMREEGQSWSAIGRSTGVKGDTVKYHLDKDFRQHILDRHVRQHRDRKAARLALQQKQEQERRTHLAKSVSGDMSVAYADIRKLAALLDKCEGKSPESRAALRDALTYVHKAEDEVVKAMRLERQS